MSQLDEVKRKLDELDRERARLMRKREQLERECHYKSYLLKLVEADIAKSALGSRDAKFKEEVLRWLCTDLSEKPRLTIKDWVLRTIGSFPNQLTPADLRERFVREFGPRHVASLRQYYSKRFKQFVQRVDGRLALTKKGQVEFAKLINVERN
jgi:hypothetical protein